MSGVYAMSLRWADPPEYRPPRTYRPNNPNPARTLAGDLWELMAEWHHARRVILLAAWRHRRELVALWAVLAFLVGTWDALWAVMPWAVGP